MVLVDQVGPEILYSIRLYLYKPPSGIPGLSATSGSWKETCLVIYDNGVLKWYNDKRCSKVKGVLSLSDVFRFIQVGCDAASMAKKPLPTLLFAERDSPALMYLPMVRGRQVRRNWFCCKSQEDLGQILKCLAGLSGKGDLFEQLCSSHTRYEELEPLEKTERYAKFGLPMNGRRHVEYWEEIWREIVNQTTNNNSSFDDSVQTSISTFSSFRSTAASSKDSLSHSPQPSTSRMVAKAVVERNDTGYSSGDSILEDYQKGNCSSFDDSVALDEEEVPQAIKENLI